jgi:hypothetical protein
MAGSIKNILNQYSGEIMDMITGAFGAINWEVVAQLSMVGLIMVAGPVVIFVLAAVRGNM